MSEKYRKMTRAEYDALFQKEESQLIIKAREFVSRNYPSTAHKVFVRPNCEYNDNYYDIRPILIVLDKNMEEVAPKSMQVVDMIFNTMNSYGSEVAEPIDNFSFFMDVETKPLPELYIKIA
jgi:hypothetical protein